MGTFRLRPALLEDCHEAAAEKAHTCGGTEKILHRLDKLEQNIMAKLEESPSDELAEKIEWMVSDALDVLKHKPATWKPYIESGDYMAIVDMEVNELKRAVTQKRGPEATRQEWTHVAAAVLYYWMMR